jgi:ATP-dependent DNA ligase
MSWTPLRLGLVAEVAYDGMQGDRFRHATQLVRWRPDREPRSCTYDQLERPVPELLEKVFSGD